VTLPSPEREEVGAKTSTIDGAPYSKENRRHSRRPKNSGSYESDHIADRFMRWFASRLMNPVVKVLVLVAFIAFSAVCAWRTTMLRQVFNFKELLPEDSFVEGYITAVEYYSDRAIALRVVFRFAEQDQPEIRQQMMDYVDDLVENVDALNEAPPLFWARDFEKLVATSPDYREMPFWEAFSAILSDPNIYDIYGKDIKFRSDGSILTSQCRLYVTDLDMDSVLDQVGLMEQQRAVSARQPINQGRELWAFFTYDVLYHIFTFFEVAAAELTSTTISSVVAVTVVAFLLIPHWTAVPIIFPMMAALFIELLGVLQMFGYAVNGTFSSFVSVSSGQKRKSFSYYRCP
jgi:Patched family